MTRENGTGTVRERHTGEGARRGASRRARRIAGDSRSRRRIPLQGLASHGTQPSFSPRHCSWLIQFLRAHHARRTPAQQRLGFGLAWVSIGKSEGVVELVTRNHSQIPAHADGRSCAKLCATDHRAARRCKMAAVMAMRRLVQVRRTLCAAQSATISRQFVTATRATAETGESLPRAAGPADIDLFYSPTPNGWKVSIMLEECGLDYNYIPVDLSKGDQFQPDFLRVSPNNRIPAIVDRTSPGEPVAVFESGAILLHLARRSGKFCPPESDLVGRKATEEWLFWQVSNLGPIAGQVSHFQNYAPHVDADTDHAYSLRRYQGEYQRLLRVMDTRLEKNRYLAGQEYTVADIACFGWVLAHKNFQLTLDPYPHLRRWYDELKLRPALRRGVELGKGVQPLSKTIQQADKELLQKLFVQNGSTKRDPGGTGQ